MISFHLKLCSFYLIFFCCFASAGAVISFGQFAVRRWKLLWTKLKRAHHAQMMSCQICRIYQFFAYFLLPVHSSKHGTSTFCGPFLLRQFREEKKKNHSTVCVQWSFNFVKFLVHNITYIINWNKYIKNLNFNKWQSIIAHYC